MDLPTSPAPLADMCHVSQCLLSLFPWCLLPSLRLYVASIIIFHQTLSYHFGTMEFLWYNWAMRTPALGTNCQKRRLHWTRCSRPRSPLATAERGRTIQPELFSPETLNGRSAFNCGCHWRKYWRTTGARLTRDVSSTLSPSGFTNTFVLCGCACYLSLMEVRLPQELGDESVLS